MGLLSGSDEPPRSGSAVGSGPFDLGRGDRDPVPRLQHRVGGGRLPVDPDQDQFDLEPIPLVFDAIDWDQLELERNVPLLGQPLTACQSVA